MEYRMNPYAWNRIKHTDVKKLMTVSSWKVKQGVIIKQAIHLCQRIQYIGLKMHDITLYQNVSIGPKYYHEHLQLQF